VRHRTRGPGVTLPTPWPGSGRSEMREAVLFDLDGTLLDTLDDLADSMNFALGCMGFPSHDREAYRYFVGDGVVEMARRALPPECRDDGVTSRCIALFRHEYSRRWNAHTRPYEGVPELLDGLTGRGMAMAVLSNKPHDFTELCVRELLGRWRFAAVIGVSETIPPKPDPAGSLTVARALGLEPGRFLYVGDTGTDMRTATAAGMFPVGALWGFRTADELLANGARILLESPPEVLDLL